MRVLVILYVLTTLIYMGVGTGDMYWAMFNMVSILGCMVGFMYYCTRCGRVSNKDKAYLRYAAYMTIGRIFYTLMCVVAMVPDIYLGNRVFTVFFAILFVIHLFRNERQ